MADRCRQTLSVIERTLDGAATDADRDHVHGCAACARAVARSPEFERGLGLATRSLATEPLARGVLALAPGAAVGRPVRRPVRWARVAGSVAAAAVLVVVLVFGIRQAGRFDGVGAAPGGLASEAAFVEAMADLGISCRQSILGPAASPPVEGYLCLPAVARSGVEAVAAFEFGADGEPHAVVVKTHLGPAAGEAGPRVIEDLLVAMAGTAFADPAAASAAGSWIRDTLPKVADGAQKTIIDGLELSLEIPAKDSVYLHIGPPPG